MGWRNWSYWLRGGIITIVLYIIFYILFILIREEGVFPPTLAGNLIYVINISFYLVLLIGTILDLLLVFLIGAFIGLIYGKFKQRKTENLNK